MPFHWGGRAVGQPADQPRARSDQPHAGVQGVRGARGRDRRHARTTHDDDATRLVVIGNGMAGARFVEEVLARGGADAFDITVFGDEPYGNYNRILLSGVLAGSHDAEGHLHQSARVVRGERRHAARRRARRRAIDRARKHVVGRRMASSSRTTSSSSPPAAGRSCRRSTGCVTATGTLSDGVFVFRTLDDCERMIRSFARDVRRGRWSSAAGCSARGGARAARAGLEVHVVHLMLAPDGGAARRGRGRHPPQRQLEQMGVQLHLDTAHDGGARRPQVSGLAVRRRHDAGVRHGGRRGRHPAQRRAGARRRPAVERGIVVADDSLPGRPGRLRGRRVRRAPRAALRPGRAAVGAGAGAGGPADRPQPRRAVPRLAGVHQAEGHGRRPARRWAIKEPVDADDEVVQYSRAGARHLQEADRPRRPARRRDPPRRRRRRAGAAAGVRPRHRAARQPLGAALSSSRAATQRCRASPTCRTTRRSATATACPRARSSRADGCRSLTRSLCDATRAGTVRVVQDAGAAGARGSRRATGCRPIRPCTTTCRACR